LTDNDPDWDDRDRNGRDGSDRDGNGAVIQNAKFKMQNLADLDARVVFAFCILHLALPA